MNVKLVYFARLREAFGVASEDVFLPGTVCDTQALTQWLAARGGAWARELAAGRAYRIAVNQTMAAGHQALANGDEIAFFPPVTGG